ncbi:MAG TPA: hypothetical protein VHT96_11220 [Clostridia bacterium]|nr:hypothetical protein [Clostridia bacterium]
MKKKYVIAGTVSIIILVLFAAVWVIQPEIGVFNYLTVSRQYVNTSEDITFEFEGAEVSFNEWGRDYVEITYDNVFSGKTKMDIAKSGNTLTLKSKLDYSGAKHIGINVPKTAIKVRAKSVEAKGGLFRAVEAETASLRYSTMADGFVSTGSEISVREGKFSGSGRLTNEIVNMRECEAKELVLSPANREKGLNAYLRQLTGISVHLDAEGCSDLSAEFKDSKLESLKIGYSGEKGSVTIFSGEINKVENNSKIKIKYKETFFG